MGRAKKAIAAMPAAGIVITPVRTIPELMWSAETLCSGKEVTFAKAEQALKDLRAGGFDDWRLPTRAELLSLVDLDKYRPAIDTALFPDTKSSFYWSSTPYAGYPADYAWGVDFYNGNTCIGYRDGTGFVRAVRSVSPAAPGQ